MNTLGKFAWQLGAHARHTLDYSLVWHKAYVKATPETRAAWEADFVVNFLLGFFKAEKMTEKQARKIEATPRTKRTKTQEKVVNAAKAKFRYHISRKTSKHTEPAKPKKVRVSTTERSAYDRFLAALGGDVERLKAIVDALA